MTPTLIPGVRRDEAARLVIGGEITHYPTIDLALGLHCERQKQRAKG